MALLFDDSEKLKEALGKEAAEVIAHVLERQEEQYKQELTTKADLAQLEGKLMTEISGLEAKIESSKSDTIKWMAGMLMVQAATVAALVKLLG